MQRVSRVMAALLLSGAVVGATVPATSAPPAVSAPTTADGPSKAKDPDGSYEGGEVPAPDNALDVVDIGFKVKRDGRKIKRFIVNMNVVCTGVPPYLEYVSQPMNPMKVNRRSGTFRDVVSGATEGGTTYTVEVTGRLKGRKVVDGTLSYDVGICQRGSTPGDPVRWTAERVSR